MKAMVLRKAGPIDEAPLHLEELPDPEPAAGQVRIKVDVCGVCHTDLHIVEGEITPPSLPLVPGHQIVGEVDLLGEGVRADLLGKRVGLAWLAGTCGHCVYCRTGRENLCKNIEFTGFTQNGGYAEYTLARAEYLVEIPDFFAANSRAAPLLCAGIIGYRSLRMTGIESGGNLGIFGFGAAAHIVIQIARHQGLAVYVFTRTWKNRELAKRLGAAWVGGPDEAPQAMLDGAISFTPKGASLRTALERVDRGGCVCCGGIYTDPIPSLDYEKHLFYEKQLRSVTAATRQDAKDFMQAAAEANVHTDIKVFPFDQANRVLSALKRSQIPKGAAVLKIT